ncbi:MAG: pilus assembly protein N-terminal domain-containing protein [Brevundimonas sp.]
MSRHFLRSAVALLAGAGLAGGVASVASAALAQARPLNIEIDSATRVQLRAPAGSVIVANPRIADVTVVDANTLFITGKGYGVTEVVAVDALGRPLFQSQIVVSAGSTGAVRVWRGGEATDMACGSSCSPSVRSASAP